MLKLKKNVIVGNLDAESRKVLNEMGFDDEFNLSESFSEYLEENNICLNEKKVVFTRMEESIDNLKLSKTSVSRKGERISSSFYNDDLYCEKFTKMSLMSWVC